MTEIQAKQITVDGHVIYKICWREMETTYGTSYTGNYWYMLDTIFARMSNWLEDEDRS